MDNPYNRLYVNATERKKMLYKFLKEENEPIKKQFHGFLSKDDMDREYEELMNQKKLKVKSGIVNLTSEKLKKEYNIQYNYFQSGIKFMFLISIMLITNTFFHFKYFKANEVSISILITSSISAGFCFMLLINIREKVLLDSVGYIPFYLSAMVESALFFFLLLIKIYDFFLIINELIESFNNYEIDDEKKYPSKRSFAFFILFNIVNIFGTLFCSKFILDLFLEGFNILILKKKTFIQKQLDIYSKENHLM